ncbi:MAG: isoleucine--tRNA ligase [Deltaproteobacteria bacterium]|nr:isoleucine--tRNA ligase [Deltaproteobacteria bacterium]
MDYKSTLNLPKTAFPMKANLPQREPEILSRWDQMELYEQIRAKSHGRPLFILHDGPPYANGHIHIGTALNKILKDMIIRCRQMDGYDVPYVPGWDCHGLPIEHQVDQQLGDKKKTMPQRQVREHCRRYAEKFIEIQKAEFIRLGVLGEWDRPYLTMNHEYVATIVREFGKFARDGSLVKSKKPIYWCSTCQTALAEAEVEYEWRRSPSIYVKFPLVTDISDAFPFLAGKQVSLPIWTTTPWTLPANLAVALHPDYDYTAVETSDGDVLILARALVDAAMAACEISDYQLLGKVDPGALERAVCRHPFYERESLIILAPHVTLDTGTGCVHTAPGHGREDYDIGLAYGLDIYSPVDDQGCFTPDVDFFGGRFVFDANSDVVDKLEVLGMLLGQGTVEHTYPHCWRCKKPVIFRATEQWFISMDKTGLRKKALRCIDEVTWIPSWGRDRIFGMIENRPDWCISRQRSWGVPIVAFYCEGCGKVMITEAIIEHVAALFEAQGPDVWFDADSSVLLPEGTTCPDCGASAFRTEKDILDVWFDSGVSHAAVLEHRDYLRWPADLYLEGSDQHRGWFHSALLTAVGTRDKAPYQRVLTHGFVVDGSGEKMSKSKGNVIAPKEIIKRYGVEILRLWVAASNYQDDIRISEKILKQLTDAYRRIRNTCRFMLGNLGDFDPDRDRVPGADMWEIDRYALHCLQGLIKRVRRGYEAFEFHVAYHSIYNYCTLDLGAFYLDVLKDRLYTAPKASKARRSAQSALHIILDALTRLEAPILAFTADEIWAHMPQGRDRPESVHLTDLPAVDETLVVADLAEKWDALLKLRAEVSKALEEARARKVIGHSLDAAVTLAVPEPFFPDGIAPPEELRTVFIVSKVLVADHSDLEGAYQSPNIAGLAIRVDPASAPKCERCWVRDNSVGKDQNHKTICARCVAALEGVERAAG